MDINENKYDIGEHIDLDTIDISELERALFEFSKGSNGLSKCLRQMWMNGLKTYSCNPGENTPFSIGRIVMEKDEDIFGYLSEEFLNDERIRIDIIDDKEVIMFSGSTPEKEGAMLFLTREIQSGRKNNRELVKEKIGEPFPDSWIRVLKNHESNIYSTYWSEKVYIKEKTNNVCVIFKDEEEEKEFSRICKDINYRKKL
jgi:hypothetical protein